MRVSRSTRSVTMHLPERGPLAPNMVTSSIYSARGRRKSSTMSSLALIIRLAVTWVTARTLLERLATTTYHPVSSQKQAKTYENDRDQHDPFIVYLTRDGEVSIWTPQGHRMTSVQAYCEGQVYRWFGRERPAWCTQTTMYGWNPSQAAFVAHRIQ